jgi:hypothetical protein
VPDPGFAWGSTTGTSPVAEGPPRAEASPEQALGPASRASGDPARPKSFHEMLLGFARAGEKTRLAGALFSRRPHPLAALLLLCAQALALGSGRRGAVQTGAAGRLVLGEKGRQVDGWAVEFPDLGIGRIAVDEAGILRFEIRLCGVPA